ncbi:MAG: hypothetical protein RIC16_03375 [Rhodospirillales bacterium]
MIAARRKLSIFCAACLAVLLMTQPANADPVQVRAATQTGTARIVFNWPAPIVYEANLDGGTLRVRFGRPIETDLDVGLAGIGAYLRDSRILGDGQTVELRLAPGNYSLSHFTAGTAVVLDLQGTPSPQAAEAETAAPAEPETTAVSEPQPASEPEPETATAQPPEPDATVAGNAVIGPAVGIRTGRHADKLRVVFDWENDVTYDIDRGAGVSTITFSAPARFDTSALGQAAPELVGEARSRAVGGGTAVDLAVPESARINVFNAGTKVVADIFFPSDGAVAGRLPAVPSTLATSQATDGTVAAIAEEQAPDTAAAETSTDQSTEPEAATADADGAATTGGAPQELSTGTAVETASSAAAVQTSGTATAGDVPIRVGPREDGEAGFAMSFDWTDPVGAAVFRRGGALWLVFDQFTPVDIDTVRATAGANLVDIVQLPHQTATVLRMITGRGINPIARRDGLTWIVEFKQQSLSTLAPIQATPQLDSPVGSRVFLPVPEPGRAVAVTDPEIGDNFIVVPIIPLGYGVTHLYQYPQFRIRPSSQGAVIEPRIDTLRIRPLREGIEVTSTRTLHISPVSPEELARTGVDDDRPLTRLVDFEPLRNVKPEFLHDKRRALEREIATAGSPQEKVRRQLDLAQFYLAHGYGAEALGVLRVRGDTLDGAGDELPHKLYVAMSEFLLGRPALARDVLDAPEFQINDEGNFWRSVAGFASNNLSGDVLRGIRSTAGIPEPYPEALRIPMSLWAIQGVLQAGDAIKAEAMLETLNAETLTPEQQNWAMLLSGRAARINGETEIAIGRFEQVAAGPPGPSHAQAVIERVEMMLELDRMSPLGAAEALETLRYNWRGGEFEFNLLRHLGNLYLRAGHFRDGLSTLRQAATYFREHPDAPKVTETMVEAFNALFLEGLADRIPPVSAIAIYEEFKELTPAGQLGDRMIQNLADRMASVDLLDSAAELLEAQIEFRLSGAEKVRVGNRLALIHMLGGSYEEAIAALDASEGGDVADEIAQERRFLRARALIGMDRDAEALSLIEDDEGLAADQLRAESHWARGNWLDASKSLRNLIDHAGITPGQTLDDEQAMYVLNYAIALTLSGNDRAIARLNRDYGPAMAETKLDEAFELIATPERFGVLNVAEVADRVREAEAFGTFLAEYEERLATTPLSAIN